MPQIRLPAGGYKFCTTIHEDKYWIGREFTDARDNRKVRVIMIIERDEDGDTKYDVYVQPIATS